MHTEKTQTADRLAWAIIAVVLAVVIGASLTFGGTRTGAALPTGDHVVEFEIDIQDMDFIPNTVEVPAGSELVLHITNSDNEQHDLRIGEGYTGRIDPGERVSHAFGVFNASTQGWCTIAGHKAMGMVFDVVVTGA